MTSRHRIVTSNILLAACCRTAAVQRAESSGKIAAYLCNRSGQIYPQLSFHSLCLCTVKLLSTNGFRLSTITRVSMHMLAARVTKVHVEALPSSGQTLTAASPSGARARFW